MSGLRSGDNSPVFTQRNTIAATKSLRPRQFFREDHLNSTLTEEEIFIKGTIPTLKNGTFLEIHTKCQLQKNEIFKFREDKNIQRAEAKAESEKIHQRDKSRQDLLDKSRNLHFTNTKFIEDIDKNWKATQRVKRNRNIRDLQFEMSMLKTAELKETYTRNHYNNEQANGFVSFEKIMRRNGLGGDESNGPPLSISYEDKKVFEQRVHKNATEKWPTNEEVSDFVTQLKGRTEEKRVARYEQERRRRRALVDQAVNTNQDI